MNIILEVIMAGVGTMAFSLLYSVPNRFYPYCGVIGGAGWLVYRMSLREVTAPTAAFAAAIVVVLLSRLFAVRKRCPVTVFLISGIFPLVPGAGIYWTAYYIVMNELAKASQTGFQAFKIAVGIVLGIAFVFELPKKFFASRGKRTR